MKVATCKIMGVSPYSQSHPHSIERLSNETHDDYAKRTWQAWLETNRDGEVILSSTGLHKCITEAAKFSGRKVPGRGNTTWTKFFGAGILIPERPILFLLRTAIYYGPRTLA